MRATLATFAPFTSDPARLLQLANTALVERTNNHATFVTAICVNIATDGHLRWACAGHCPPWRLDIGEPLKGGQQGLPLGLAAKLDLEPGTWNLPIGAGIVLFTDGLPEGRPAHRDRCVPLELYGEHRMHEVLTAHPGASPRTIANALLAEVVNFAGGALADDVCVIVCRATSQVDDHRHPNVDR